MTTDFWKVAVLIAAAAMFVSSVWGAIAFFKVQDAQALSGKRRVSLIGGAAIALSLWNVSRAELVVPLRFAAALALLAGGAGLFWLAVYTCRRQVMAFAFAATVPADLIVDGPYRHVRHPFYSSYLLGWAGCLVAAPNALSLSIFAVMAWIYRAAAIREESVLLASSWGPAYRDYVRVTGRFVPRLRLKVRGRDLRAG